MKKKTFKSIVNGLWIRLLHHLARHSFPSFVRVFFHRLRGAKIGKNVLIGLDVHIDDDHPSKVIIGNNVFVTSEVMFLTHKRDVSKYHEGQWIGDCPMINSNIIIENGVHIGVRSLIMPGVKIGEGAIIGSGALVTKDIPAYSLAVGIPAKVIKSFK